MKQPQRKRESTPPQASFRESPTLLREIGRVYQEETAAIIAYIYGQILLEQHLRAAADLFYSIACAKRQHLYATGQLLRNLGAFHGLRINAQNPPYRLQEDVDSQAPVIAAQMMNDLLRYEKNACFHIQKLAGTATAEHTRATLAALAKASEEYAAALQTMATRLSLS